MYIRTLSIHYNYTKFLFYDLQKLKHICISWHKICFMDTDLLNMKGWEMAS